MKSGEGHSVYMPGPRCLLGGGYSSGESVVGGGYYAGGEYAVADLRGARGTQAPWGPNSFNFMHFLGKFGKFVCWRPHPRELVPPPRGNPGSALVCIPTHPRHVTWDTHPTPCTDT